MKFDSDFAQKFTKEWNDIRKKLNKYDLSHIVIVPDVAETKGKEK